MKKYFVLLLFTMVAISLKAQESDDAILSKINNGQTVTATTKSASRLFADKDDLTSVIYILPVGSTVDVTGLDSAYYQVKFEGDEGFIKKNQAIIDVTSQILAESSPTASTPSVAGTAPTTPVAAVSQADTASRLADLISRYDAKTAQSIYERKIWKGMNTDMVIDSWGNPKKINRTIIPDSVTEEWSYTSSWLYFEDDILVSWGPIDK